MTRVANIERNTTETQIKLELNIDGEGIAAIDTPVPFMNHMLELWTRHGLFDLTVKANGDVEIDDHHTTEDLGICLGTTFKAALGDKKGIKRYGNAFVPMDETLVQVVVDLSNRPHLELRAHFPAQKLGTFNTELIEEFLLKFALEARINLHVIVHYGKNTHHIIEAIFKALARALDEATTVDSRIKGILSTKGLL